MVVAAFVPLVVALLNAIPAGVCAAAFGAGVAGLGGVVVAFDGLIAVLLVALAAGVSVRTTALLP